MRKIIIIVLIVILFAGALKMMIGGIEIGNMKVFSIKEISSYSQNLDNQIERLNSTIQNGYVEAQENLQVSLKNLQESKQKYQEAITYSTTEEIRLARKAQEYEIGYLWTKIGLYATKNNIVMQAVVSQGSVDGLYNISFTALGPYISTSEFIYAIEDDSNLGFKIEDFTMSKYTGSLVEGESLKSTFIIRNIPINRESLTSQNISYNTNISENNKSNSSETKTTNANN